MSDLVHKTSPELDVLIPEIWSAAFYPTLLEKLPFNGSIARNYEGEIRQLGDTVNVSEFPQFDVASEIGEAQRVDADAVTVQQIKLIINKQVAKDYIITKKGLIQSIDSQTQLRDLAMHSILKKIHEIIIADIAPSAAAPDHTIAYSSGTTLALVDIIAAKKLLDQADVPELGRTAILGPNQYNDLFNITGFVSRDFIPAGSPLTEGAVQTPVLGFDIRWGTPIDDTSYWFVPQFMQIAFQQNPDVMVYDLGLEGKRATRVNMDVLFGVKQFSDTRVVTVA